MKTPKVKIDSTALSEISLTEENVIKEVEDAIRLAETIAEKGVTCFENILAKNKRKKKKEAWENDKWVKTFFGDSAPSIPQMRKTKRRIGRAHRRLANTKLTIRVKPQPAGTSTRAKNLGTVFSPKTFQLYPAWFDQLSAEYDGNNGSQTSSDNKLRRASIIVHELNHDLFFDQKLNGNIVYGEELAKDLADQKPRKARKSSENFEWFCMRLQDASGKL